MASLPLDGAPPGQIGSHDGYVDAEAITYTVVRYLRVR